MDLSSPPSSRWSDPLVGRFWRLAASGWLPARWVQPPLPPPGERAARTGRLHLEIVSHCWQYAHLQRYQLSSLVRFPPRDIEVTMTVYHSRQDEDTVRLLQEFGQRAVPGVSWNWRDLPPPSLFRRAIGRNEAARRTEADWIWFTDCDLLFRADCLDALGAALQGSRESLVYPRTEYVTPLLSDEHPMLSPEAGAGAVVDIDPSLFHASSRGRATGPLQITHGDIARAAGYCEAIRYYQRPAPAWTKAYEDRAFRWLLGTQGRPVDVPGVYRIRHQSKGRYTGSGLETRWRMGLRRVGAWLRERRKAP